ncbi:MAG: hypothetical protein PHE78_01080 [Candidatus Gastranaerophilales bacterium]|nr:hypothetical protein [Candidatus Gastranaerophilales bacterium]
MKKYKKLKKLFEEQNKKLLTHLEMQTDQNTYFIEALVENQGYNYFMMKTIVDTGKLFKNNG